VIVFLEKGNNYFSYNFSFLTIQSQLVLLKTSDWNCPSLTVDLKEPENLYYRKLFFG